MSAAPKPSEGFAPSLQSERLYLKLRDCRALIVMDGPAPHRAVAEGDARRRPVAWVDGNTLAGWRAQGLLRSEPRGWSLLSRPGPRPIVADTPDGPRHVDVRENWMQRLARDLDLHAGLAEAGHRLVADGLRLAARSMGTSATEVVVDGARRADAQEMRILARLGARKRVTEALAQLSPSGRAAAEGVCLHDRSLAEVAGALGISEGEAAESFTLALLKLAQHYGTLPGLGMKRS